MYVCKCGLYDVLGVVTMVLFYLLESIPGLRELYCMSMKIDIYTFNTMLIFCDFSLSNNEV